MKTEIVNGQVLINAKVFISDSLTIEDESIAGIGISGERKIDATGLYVLPGIVDIHADAFEKLIHPRPGVSSI